MDEHESGRADHEEHDHGTLHFQGCEVTDGTLAQVKETHATLAGVLETARRWSALTDDEKKELAIAQVIVEKSEGWAPGYHSAGDKCATCGLATLPLFTDRFEGGELTYGAFLRGLPVHATKECLDGFAGKRPGTSPRDLDKARRELMQDLERPSPKMTQFFRHDLFAHPAFGLEDWANSVAEAQQEGLGRGAMKDIERLVRYVHPRLFHHH
jgi:hypothetical protein